MNRLPTRSLRRGKSFGRARRATSAAAIAAGLLIVATPEARSGVRLPSSVQLPDPPCPDGTERDYGHGSDGTHGERLWVECSTKDEEGLPVRQGPYRTYAVERDGGEVSFRLVDMREYEAGTWHGIHRRWTGPGELVLEETFVDGELHGESRSWYSSGDLREVRHLREGKLHGERRAWYPSGEQRWTAVYKRGVMMSVEGERTVAGEPCPEGALPVASADGLEEYCERRRGRVGDREGPYVVWNADGEIVERGLYRNDRKAEVWDAPPGAPPSPDELAGVLVAEAWLLAGEKELTALTDAEPDIWFRDLNAKDFIHPEYEREGSKVLISELPPGRYGIFLRIDANPSNPEYYPGDLGASAPFEVEHGAVTRFEVQLDRILHLTEPFDNGATLRGLELGCDEQPALPSPTRFTWEPPVPPAPDVEYRYTVQRVECSPLRKLGVAARGTTRQTAIELKLQPSRPGEAYFFRLRATSDGETVGFLTSHGPRKSQAWHVPFRIGGE